MRCGGGIKVKEGSREHSGQREMAQAKALWQREHKYVVMREGHIGGSPIKPSRPC